MIGESPIIGAGNYCDGRYGGAACTGFGELAMRALTAKTTVDRLARGMSASAAARRAIADVNALEPKDPPAMNVIVLANDGSYASATNRAGREFAVMTRDMSDPRIDRRIVVR